MPLQLLSSGSNAHGQLGHSQNEDSNTFIPCNFLGIPKGELPAGAVGISQVATGANHSVVLLNFSPLDGQAEPYTELWGCGDGRAGQLGEWYKKGVHLNSKPTRTDVFRKLQFPLKEYDLENYQCKLVAAGWETTYLVLSPSSNVRSGSRGDIVISMGSDDWGDLGIGPAKPQPERSKTAMTYTPSHLNVVSFDSILIDGSPLSSQGLLKVDSLAANQHHVLAHLRAEGPERNGCVVGWGAARHGQISPPATASPPSAVPSKRPSVFDTPRFICVEDPDDPFVKCAVGSQHSALLKASRTLICLGSNRKGQLNVLGSSRTRTVDCTWNGTFTSTFDEEKGYGMRATGSNTHGQLGSGSLELSAQESADGVRPVFPERLRQSKLSKLACGTEHVLTLWETPDSHREVWAWGWNEHGNLGLGTTQDAHSPVRIPISTGVRDVWAGSGTSWIVCDTGSPIVGLE
ncbi:RCC1/BLIP-II [Coprinellus micaceus]|uniref:RCC1/BLIP-II n=1 Tax=Coprinellus micaceus TaxID=71717 RepID=A0A4Y7TDR4_COPMI|nr:RCC1/BLIP-II [Coprinellus micaceus]